MKAAELTGRDLDYWMYQHACKVLNKKPTKQEFDQGYGEGKFHFSEDLSLLQELMVTYTIRVQYLAEEWLASNTTSSVYGETPIQAVCRLVVINQFGQDVSD